DQSYFLFGLTQGQLAHAAFPLGSFSKQAVREMARRSRLPVAEKPESQEICFVPSGNYTDFIKAYRHENSERRLAEEEKASRGDESENRRTGEPGAAAQKDDGAGELVTTSGEVVGTHSGIQHFTVGQRRGLGISAPRPLYVLQIDPDARRVTVGEEKDLWRESLEVRDVNWIAWPALHNPIEASVKIRYRHEPAPALLEPTGGASVRVH